MSSESTTPSPGDDLSASTKRMTGQAHEHERLLMCYIAGDREPDLLNRLAELIADDAELRDELRDELALDRVLRQHGRLPLDPAPVLTAIAVRHRSSLSDQVMAGIARAQQPPRLRRWWVGVMAAAALVMVAVFAANSWLGQRGMTPVIEVEPFASVHYVRDVVWPSDLTNPPRDGSRLAPGALALIGGVVEVRFDNGVVLALEGPVQVDLRSRMQSHLRHGRLTTNVPSAAQGFTVVADHLRVIDLGTEAGIELSRDGYLHVQVYTGAVELRFNDAEMVPEDARIGAGQARAFNPVSGTVQSSAFDAGRYVRTGPPRPLTLAVSDLVGGGDGRGTARADGLDPKRGSLRSEGSIGGSRADAVFHPLADLPFIDGVFVPGGAQKPTVISSAGHTYTFPGTGGSTYDLIRRGGFIIRPPDGNGVVVPTRSPTVISGVDHASFGHHLIGMHASAGVTIDLHALGKAYGRQPTRFTSVVANAALRQDAPILAAPPRGAQTLGSPIPWTVLEPGTFTTVAGSTLTRQADHSVLAWPVQNTDTFTITGATSLRRLSAIRLEVLPDPVLPNGGPGTAENGNFILSHVRAAVITPTTRTNLELIGVVADFNQANWHCSNLLRGDDAAGWAVIPETGRAHQAVFFCNPVELPPGAHVEIVLAQVNPQYAQHLIGKFRLALTDAIDPVEGVGVGSGNFLVLVDGKLRQRTVVPTADQAPARLDVVLTPTDRFLTLVSCDGGYGSRFQWTTLGDPQIELVP